MFLTPSLPEPPADLTLACPDPGVTGDKGRDALRHRTALARCEARRSGWQGFYEAVKEAQKGDDE